MRKINNHNFVLWLLGPTSAGKTTLAEYFEKNLRTRNIPIIHFDGDEVRKFFGPDLDFSDQSRFRVVEVLVHLSNKALEAGLNVVVSALTASSEARDFVRNNVRKLIIGYIKCPIEVCAERDPKGLYEKAQNGHINTLIGYNSRYLPPEDPDIVLDTELKSLEKLCKELQEFLIL